MKSRRTKKGLMNVIMLILAAMLVLSACGNAGPATSAEPTATPSGSGDTATQTPTDSGGASDLKPYEIKLVYTGGVQADEAKVEAAINEYLKDKINATVDISPIDWGPWEEQLNLMIAGREKFDVVFTAQWQKYAVNVNKGAFMDLGNLLKEHGQDIISSLDPAYLEGSKINGINYAVPTNKEIAAQGGIIYRKDIAEELQLDMSQIKTTADLEPILAVVKEKRPELTPLYLKEGDHLGSHYLINYDPLGDTSIPGGILKDLNDTTVKPVYEFDRFTDNLKLTRNLFVKGYINSDASTSEVGGEDALKAGNVFAIPASLKPGKYAEVELKNSQQGMLAQIELSEKTTATSETAGAMLAISTTSEDPERAMMFINLLHSDKYLNNLINFGIENDHYEKVSDNIIKATDNSANYAPGANWMLGNQFLNYVWTTEDPNKWEAFAEFNSGSKVSPGLGFTFNNENVTAEVAAVINVDQEFLVSLETGSVDPDKVLPEYIEKLRVAGLEKILTEKQRQFDEFLANK